MHVLTLAAGLGLALAQPRVAAPASDTDRFTIDTSASAKTLKLGRSGKVTFRIVPAPGSHVATYAPLKISLASDGLSLTKRSLSARDIARRSGKQPKFSVSVRGKAAGAAEVRLNARFFVCTDDVCELQQAAASIPVTVHR